MKPGAPVIHIHQARVPGTRRILAGMALARILPSAFCLLPFLALAEPVSSSAILQELRSFREMGSVLCVAAHPDDENTRLIAYLARGRCYRTGYLSITRGDGGQNLIGPEIGDELGVIRTQELLAARRIDGGQQFFTRAKDFGFSKDYRETFKFWDKQQILSDVVRVIRTFRPDVIVNRFSTQPGNTHGHHTASAILGLEAFKLAGDTNAFPEQLRELKPWQPKRIVQNSGGFGRGGGGGGGGGGLQMEVGGYNPLLGESYGEIAARSRSMHKTQGFGSVGGRGGAAESFTVLAGEPASKDIMDGVDTTWGRVPGGAEIGVMADDLIAHFDATHPEAGVPALLKIHKLLASLPSDSVIEDKRRQFDHILQCCLGLFVETTVRQAEVVPGETLALQQSAMVRANVPVRWIGVRYPGETNISGEAMDLAMDKTANRETTRALPTNTPLSQPYWLREEGTIGRFQVDDPALIGRAENPPVFPLEQVFEVAGERFVVPDEPMRVYGDPVKGEIRRRLRVIPPVSLSFVDNLELFPPGAARPAEVEVTAARDHAAGALRLAAPEGWQVTPATQSFSLTNEGESARFAFTITAPAQTGTAEILANADVDGVSWHTRRVELRYDHIPPQLLQPPARLKALSLELAVRAHRVGYIPGAGDEVAEALTRMGCEVTQLAGADLTAERLSGLDAVVVGIRAFNVRADLAPHLTGLFDFAEGGGNVIVLYNRPGGRQALLRVAPYELSLSNERVTDETAPMTLLAPDHPAFTTPNKIVPADFDGWVQERGAYFASQWDSHFTPLLECNDPGEPPLKGGLLVARYGKGYFAYTGLSWFRQLPDGVPGAYRLFANLVSLGK
jgi:LmbE family N-acetylglucosaminyl deacetylase